MNVKPAVIVYVENIDGQFKKSAFEAVSYAREIAGLRETALTAVSVGNVPDTALEELGKYGASKILNIRSEKLKTFSSQGYASVIAQAAKAEKATVIILSSSFSGKGLAPRIAIKLDAALVPDVTGLPEISGQKLTVRRNAFSGKAFATVESEAEIKILTLTPNAFKLTTHNEKPEIVSFEAEIKENEQPELVKDIIRESGKVSLTDAEIVVSGGRGMKGPENWGIIEELAGLLGAATACSKPVSDAGWRPHAEHVGQTGITIAPDLYIAIGISGAIQHLAGVSSSRVIVAINKDPEAPFFKAADYGIAGDAFEVVPKLIEALKNQGFELS